VTVERVQKLRDYWSVVSLAAFAIALVIVGIWRKNDTISGAGYAFAGAAITRAVDIAQECGRAEAETQATRRRDLDETRRLLYMALVSRGAELSPELTATLVNALAHHGLGVRPLVSMQRLRSDREPWLRQQIEEVNRRLGD
jgi:hypothetical protein